MRRMRAFIGMVVLLSLPLFGRPVLRLTDDIGVRIFMVAIILAVAGAGVGLLLVDRNDVSK